MPLISYAQNREDVLLHRLFGGQESGFYVDVGANDPVSCSVTKIFSDRGWRGINVEPVPALHARLCRERPQDVNLNVGLSDFPGRLTFFEARPDPGWSTFSTDQAANLRAAGIEVIERSVEVTTLAAVCEAHADPTRPIEFLKVDAESHEFEVLTGADWGPLAAWAVVVEDNGAERWESILRSADYHLAARDGVNRFYLRDEDCALAARLELPVNMTDDFIPYEYHRDLNDLRVRLAEQGELGPTTLAVARRLQRLAARFPALARAVKGIVRLAG